MFPPAALTDGPQVGMAYGRYGLSRISFSYSISIVDAIACDTSRPSICRSVPRGPNSLVIRASWSLSGSPGTLLRRSLR